MDKSDSLKYFVSLRQERNELAAANHWYSVTKYSAALGFGALLLTTGESPLNAISETHYLTNGISILGFTVSSAACIVTAYHIARSQKALGQNNLFEERAVDWMARSPQGEELSWVADFIDPPTED